MAGRSVQLRVGGQSYRVVTSANDDELRRLAAMVDDKLTRVVPPGRPMTPQAMLLAAMALAHELEEARARADAVAARAKAALGSVLARVDAALDVMPEPGPEPAGRGPRRIEPAPEEG
jgi:cell division protein ZapA